MTEEIGRIEKPVAEHFKQRKKIYLVPLLFAGESVPPEYREKCTRYWQQVEEQLTNLETKIGKVKRIYHESIMVHGDDGMEVMKGLNSDSHKISKSRCENGAILETIEDAELLKEVVDWQRCLFRGLTSEKVASTISQFYFDASKERYRLMAEKISETLEDNEAGLLFISEGSSLQYPDDIEVFSVFPPVLDEIHRWLRDQATNIEEAEVKDTEEAEEVKDAKVAKEVKDTEKAAEVKDAKVAKEVKDAEKTAEVKDVKVAKEVKDAEKAAEVKDVKVAKEVKDAEKAAEVKDVKVAKEVKDAEEAEEVKDAKVAKEVKDAEKAAEVKDAKVAKEVKDAEE
ncbi:MAG: hypothetical protein SU899_01345 [Chloroflexota bacterium]|nr:hypothetical protein [Chloroflexota bacterium]